MVIRITVSGRAINCEGLRRKSSVETMLMEGPEDRGDEKEVDDIDS